MSIPMRDKQKTNERAEKEKILGLWTLQTEFRNHSLIHVGGDDQQMIGCRTRLTNTHRIGFQTSPSPSS